MAKQQDITLDIDFCPCDECDFRGACKHECKSFEKYVQLSRHSLRKNNLDKFMRLQKINRERNLQTGGFW